MLVIRSNVFSPKQISVEAVAVATLFRQEAVLGLSRGNAIVVFIARVTTRKTTVVSGRASCRTEATEIMPEASLGRQVLDAP